MIWTLRDATPEDIPALAQVHVDTWRSTYRGIVPDEYLANLSYERRADGWHKILNQASEIGDFTYVAEDEFGAVIGFAGGGLERTGDPLYKGEVKAIYILHSYQKQGLGRCFLRAVAENLNQSGIYSLLIWVLVDNPACQFYAALGGTPVYEKELEIGGKRLSEVAYGWMDTANLRST
jgi:GNAT superfamily N-acetyltransferase